MYTHVMGKNNKIQFSIFTPFYKCQIRAAMVVENPEGYLYNPIKQTQNVITIVDAAIAYGMYVVVGM